jgi:hypothetical protein
MNSYEQLHNKALDVRTGNGLKTSFAVSRFNTAADALGREFQWHHRATTVRGFGPIDRQSYRDS